jgi:aminopeptidase
MRAEAKGSHMSTPMTNDEAARALKGLIPQIEAYAELIVRKGLAIRKGQEVVVQAPVERADFARIVVEHAYAAGAGHVTVIWGDDAVTRMTYENVELDYFKHTPSWKREQLDSLAADGACFLFVDGADPAALEGIDPAKPAVARRARNTECATFRNGMDFGKNVWCIAGAPVAAWAKKLFPDCGDLEATYHLWCAILSAARADGEDPQGTWETHNAAFEKNKRLLNEAAFDRLHYVSKNGTDLTVGLNAGHVWAGGAGRTVDGTVFFPNIPTEEVFTTPDRMRCDGIVYSAMPLVYAGQIVDGFWLRFEGGRVVDFGAKRGKDVLRSIVEADENSCRLGECALISKNTPIRQSGILFYDTLYDENASCHLALGLGFPECVKGGFDMEKDELIAHGVNQSSTHVDFMIGSDDINIWGITASGEEIPVFENGQWAWEIQ